MPFYSPESSKYKLNDWREDLHLSDQDWIAACAGAPTKSISGRIKLIQYRWLMRTYVQPVDIIIRISNQNNEISPYSNNVITYLKLEKFSIFKF